MSFMVMSNMGVSDHECLSVSLETGTYSLPADSSIPVTKKTPLGKVNSDKFLLKLNSIRGKEKLNKFLENHTNAIDVEQMSSDLIDLLTFASEKHKPIKKVE